jgi:hypothetical protein
MTGLENSHLAYNIYRKNFYTLCRIIKILNNYMNLINYELTYIY